MLQNIIEINTHDHITIFKFNVTNKIDYRCTLLQILYPCHGAKQFHWILAPWSTLNKLTCIILYVLKIIVY